MTRLPTLKKIPAVSTLELSLKGEWINVPSLDIDGVHIISNGRWPKIASIADEEWLERDIDDPESCLQALMETKAIFRADLFTFSQRLPTTAPKYPYPRELESIAAIHVTKFKDWWDKLPSVTRKNVRRAEKRGVVTKVVEFSDQLVRDIVELTKDSPVRQGKRFIHYGKTFEQVKKDQSTHLGRCDFICSYSGDELVGMAKIIYGGESASILQFLPKASQQDKRPANALIAKMVEVCEKKGISYLVYGMYNYGNKRNASLLEFKIRNGFEEFLLPRYYVPLNVVGRLGFRFKLHRGLVGVLPNGVISSALALRERWYNLTGSLSRRSSMLEQSNRIRQMGRSTPPAGSNQEVED